MLAVADGSSTDVAKIAERLAGWSRPPYERIRTMPVLETRTGQIALLFAICRYLWVIGEGSDLDQTEKHLRAEGADIVTRLAR